MPYLELSRDYRMFYKIDDFTDPWTRPETVLLVHGFPESTEAWHALIPHLARRFRCIRIDRRGFGQSGPVPKDFNYTDELFVDDLVRVIEQVGVRRRRLHRAALPRHPPHQRHARTHRNDLLGAAKAWQARTRY